MTLPLRRDVQLQEENCSTESLGLLLKPGLPMTPESSLSHSQK
jgi:hypothetical protein